jgi:hypothetical protein
MIATIFDPIQRPGLAYQHGLDWLAVNLGNAPGPIACLISSHFHLIEMLRRLPDISLLTPVPEDLEIAAKMVSLSRPRIAEPNERGFAAVAWLEPCAEHRVVLPWLRRILSPEGRLFVVAGGRLGRFLTDRRRPDFAHRDHLHAPRVMPMLKHSGFNVQASVGWQDLRATGWHYLGEAARRLGRPDIRDRCHFAMRARFSNGHPAAGLVALVGITAEPTMIPGLGGSR